VTLLMGLELNIAGRVCLYWRRRKMNVMMILYYDDGFDEVSFIRHQSFQERSGLYLG
jgi:hypothetical protein